MASFIFSSIVLLFMFCGTIFAEVPNEITYSGRLREYGQPVNGTRTMIFRICAEDGSELWTSNAQTITVSSGVFSYRLTPNLDWRKKDLYIETSVNGKTLSPREKITAQAFSLHSRTAEDIEKSAGSSIHFSIGSSTYVTISPDGTFNVYGGFNLIPPGTIFIYGSNTAPTGWLLCDGSSYLRSTYPNLFTAIGTAFGSADGTHFNVPDFRGRFLRGLDNGQGRDPDRASRSTMNAGGATGDNVGSVQTDAMQGHWHVLTSIADSFNMKLSNDFAAGTSKGMGESVGYSDAQADKAANFYTDGINGTPRKSSETRPINAYVNYIIKY